MRKHTVESSEAYLFDSGSKLGQLIILLLLCGRGRSSRSR
jgi:hypothetical protein